jgi:pimeloyl-ACP methyl ester carboxylesterase
MPHITIGGRRLAYEWLGEGGRTLVFLHEGLGSIRRWRDFPSALAAASGCRALVYDRYGYGQSDVLAEPRVGTDYMHREALETLPALLRALEIEDPVLVGHSDGASIAILYAGAGRACKALVLLAPHVFVEDVSVRSIEAARDRFETTDMPERLAKYHRDPVKTFHLWNDVWLDPEFRRWNIESYLPGIRCPVLVIQGEDDPYGTMAQVEAIRRQVSGPCEVLPLPECRHSPHRDQPERTLAAIADFVARLPA